jgi:hypothetical protein
VSDRADSRIARAARALALATSLAAAGAGCSPHSPEPPPPDGGTPCTRAAAVAANEVVIVAGACNPWCIHVPAGAQVWFYNQDPVLYLVDSDPPVVPEMQLPASGATSTPPLAAGTVTFTAVQAPSATVTVFVE